MALTSLLLGLFLSAGAWQGPTGEIRGSVVVPKNDSAPAAVVVFLSPSSAKVGEPARPRLAYSQVECPVRERRFSCRVPVGVLDLRLRPSGYVAQYRWGAEVRAGQATELGSFAFMSGASVVGWVVGAEGPIDPRSCRIQLQPNVSQASALAGPRGAARRQTMSEATRPNERGFFHLDGIRRGVYTLIATQPGFAPTRVPFLSVHENGETDAGRIELYLPADVRFQVNPALDPLDRRWKIELWSGSAKSFSSLNVEKTVTAGEDGSFTIRALAPGHYAIRVSDPAGSAVGWQEIDLPTRESPIAIDLRFVWVDGRLRLGERPLAGDIWFGGRNGLVAIRMNADEEGRFAGLLPRPGVWRVDVETEGAGLHLSRLKVTVPKRAVGEKAKVEIRLPDTRVRGTVVDPEGAPAAGAQVLLLDDVGPARATTAEDGTFRFLGVSPGDVLLSAEQGDSQSDDVTVGVSENSDSPEVQLLLRRYQRLRGRLVGGDGPLQGVEIMAFPLLGVQALGSSPTATDQDGVFETKVPAGSLAVEIVAFPPGYALVVQPALLPSSEPIVLHARTDGGALRLRFPATPADEMPSTSWVALFTEAGFLDESLLRLWAGLNGVTSDDAHDLFAPALPPGSYRVCRVPESTPIATRLRLAAGGLRSGELSCVEGEIVAGAELVLRVPED
ncbi:MAG: carboxypeptidase regulatory-like domain-containing protein [Acidobacteriota bacterium]